MLSKLTIAGLHHYTEGHIWDGLELPEGIDKDILISEIIRQCSEFSVIYTEPIFLNKMIMAWGKKWYHNFDRWIKAYNFEYNALYNLDVEATYTDDNKTHTEGESDIRGTITGQKAAYDSEVFKNATNDINSNHSTGKNTVKTDNIRTERRFGNQGITMSQEMLAAEYDIWKANVYQMMAEIFATEFCICIYD